MFNSHQKHDHFDIYVINFQSIIAKQADFSLFINENHPDIIFGAETWLFPSIKSSEFIPQFYMTIRHDRNDGYGGVLIGIHNDLNVIECLVNQVCDLVICKILLTDADPIFLCVPYRAPNSGLTYFEAVISTLTDISHNNLNSPVWIADDFDLPIIDWKDGSISGHNTPIALLNYF